MSDTNNSGFRMNIYYKESQMCSYFSGCSSTSAIVVKRLFSAETSHVDIRSLQQGSKISTCTLSEPNTFTYVSLTIKQAFICKKTPKT